MMKEFTDKAKEKFKEWYRDFYLNGTCDEAKAHCRVMEDFFFDNLPDSMKWGVFQDFADSLKYDIEVSYHEITGKFKIYIAYLPNKHHVEIAYSDTRKEARELAIKKLNELINN